MNCEEYVVEEVKKLKDNISELEHCIMTRDTLLRGRENDIKFILNLISTELFGETKVHNLWVTEKDKEYDFNKINELIERYTNE